MQIKLAAGVNFIDDSQNKGDVIINEAAARLLGFSSPAAAVGQKMNLNANTPATIKGVMKDYHQLSMKESILPMFHYYQAGASFYSLKLQHGDPKRVLTRVQAVWKKISRNGR